ncbi:ABC transporter ATP-binding protein [Clostridium sp. 'deep sea']|uniref:ABC transporter ATP-binding protein n=1 Tax=Clostridium sp. 'deep sea' TaxID=2779445 RepID=UPI001896639E|nr:ABC transporter ATP-binding protein [Clostridium sp. 'deep sea']QOR36436.1 ABC transporter ATP-binding protein [Clostridium sp. 'deep sea']
MRLSVNNGCFSYIKNKPILQNLSLTLQEGKLLCVLGENGVGKTTFLNCLTGVLKWKSGYVSINGKKIEGISKEKDIAYVPQAHAVKFPYTALDMVCMGRTKHMGFFATPSKTDKEIALQSINNMGITHLAARQCSKMSGGQLQLVYIARALAGDPKLIILDEPEAHLDFKNQELIIQRIRKLVDDKKISCIMNTHSPVHALKVSDNTLLLGRNCIYDYGKTGDVLTEKNINRFFNVKTKIVDLDPLGIKTKAFVLLSDK